MTNIFVVSALAFLSVVAVATPLSPISSRQIDANPQPAPPLKKPTLAPTGKGDPLYSTQWHHEGMRVPEAWKITKGSRDTVLAFIDSGIDYNHPEIGPNLRWNDSEWPSDGRDKDGNGYKDDVIGFDFAKNVFLPFDGAGHGTFLSGLAAAVEDNGIGIAGVCPRCLLLPMKFITSEGFGDTEDAIEGIDYATKVKADVINVSFSGEGYDKPLHDSLKRAMEGDIVVVAAASNDGLNLDKEDIYPAKFDLPNMLTVAASDPKDKLWRYSNWGIKSVHIAAPGTDVLSIWSEKTSGYDTGSGTSDAAAIVSGAVGLIRSANPSLTAVQTVEIVQRTVRAVPSLADRIKSGGVIDVGAAVRCAIATDLPCLREK